MHTDQNIEQVVMHTDQNIEPVAFIIECDGDVGRGEGGVAGQGVTLDFKMGTIVGHPDWSRSCGAIQHLPLVTQL